MAHTNLYLAVSCTVVPEDHYNFSGDLIWKTVTEVDNLTEVQGKIPSIPVQGIAAFTIDRCIIFQTLLNTHILELIPTKIALYTKTLPRKYTELYVTELATVNWVQKPVISKRFPQTLP